MREFLTKALAMGAFGAMCFYEGFAWTGTQSWQGHHVLLLWLNGLVVASGVWVLVQHGRDRSPGGRSGEDG